MASFRVGQRVRIVNPLWAKETKGAEAIILAGPVLSFSPLGLRGDVYHIDIIGCPGNWFAVSDELAPLTDPKADEFIESIKKLKPYDEPVAPKRVTA